MWKVVFKPNQTADDKGGTAFSWPGVSPGIPLDLLKQIQCSRVQMLSETFLTSWIEVTGKRRQIRVKRSEADPGPENSTVPQKNW